MKELIEITVNAIDWDLLISGKKLGEINDKTEGCTFLITDKVAISEQYQEQLEEENCSLIIEIAEMNGRIIFPDDIRFYIIKESLQNSLEDQWAIYVDVSKVDARISESGYLAKMSLVILQKVIKRQITRKEKIKSAMRELAL